MMTLELNNEEATELSRVLSDHLKELQVELVHTTQRGYRTDLRALYERLEHLREKVAAQAEAPEAYV